MSLPKRQQSGNAMVEFALVFLLFLMIVFGLIEFGRAVWAYTSVAHAARMGGRHIIVHGSINPTTPTKLKEAVTKNAMGLDPTKIVVTATPAGPWERGDFVSLRVQYPFQFVAGPLVAASSSPMALASTTRVMVGN